MLGRKEARRDQRPVVVDQRQEERQGLDEISGGRESWPAGLRAKELRPRPWTEDVRHPVSRRSERGLEGRRTQRRRPTRRMAISKVKADGGASCTSSQEERETGTSKQGSMTKAEGRAWELNEYDILRSKRQYLSKERLGSRRKNRVAKNPYDSVIACPPGATFARARYSGRPGPPPLRPGACLRGFPRLKGCRA